MSKNHCWGKAFLFTLTFCLTDGVLAEPYLTTPQPTILFSVNDGEAPSLLEEGPDAAVQLLVLPMRRSSAFPLNRWNSVEGGRETGPRPASA